jgi:hypothetical protein
MSNRSAQLYWSWYPRYSTDWRLLPMIDSGRGSRSIPHITLKSTKPSLLLEAVTERSSAPHSATNEASQTLQLFGDLRAKNLGACRTTRIRLRERSTVLKVMTFLPLKSKSKKLPCLPVHSAHETYPLPIAKHCRRMLSLCCWLWRRRQSFRFPQSLAHKHRSGEYYSAARHHAERQLHLRHDGDDRQPNIQRKRRRQLGDDIKPGKWRSFPSH